MRAKRGRNIIPTYKKRSKLKPGKVCPRQLVSFRTRTITQTTASQVKERVLWSVSQDVNLVVLSPLTPPVELSQL